MDKSSYSALVGSLPIGESYPIRIQSMTNAYTLNTEDSVQQIMRIADMGGEMVRLAVPTMRDAKNLVVIKELLQKRGYMIPLIADVHFNPAIAEEAASIVEKVRINPGNYVDRHTGRSLFSDSEYSEELERIYDRLKPLIEVCLKNNTAIRVGINHGSLSERIMSRYGDTPEGMVASAMEFIDIFRSENFYNLVISMKSSSTRLMVNATQLLFQTMKRAGYSYPLHIGVTEAGEGFAGRIRSAAGIGALLSENIGNTIRVSLSEPPENEIPVAKMIVESVNKLSLSQNGDMIFFEEDEADSERFAIHAAVVAGKYLLSGTAKNIHLSNKFLSKEIISDIESHILQETEVRITHNQYISCPTCGRTKYDLPTTVKQIKEATKHLTGLKIAVMGCIVNGPGEMRGADWGYVGAGDGKVTIYKGAEPVLSNIPQAEAIDKLLALIQKQ